MTENADFDTTGIDSRFLANIPEGAQERIAAVDKDMRFVWNDRVKKYQIVYREPGLMTQYDDGAFLQGWGLVATFDPPLEVDVVCRQMGYRKNFEELELKRLGFKTIEEYLDYVPKAMVDDDDPSAGECDARTKQLVSDQLDDFCATFAPHVTKVGSMGEFGNSHRLVEAARQRALNSTSRAHSGKFRPTLLLPKRKERPALIVPNDLSRKVGT